MHRPRRVTPTGVVTTALAGTIVGHWLAYFLAFPDPVSRAHVLATTGHSWLHLGKQVVAVLLAATIVAAVRNALTPRRVSRCRHLAVSLLGLQLGSFLAVEVTERLAAHVSPAQLLGDHLLVLGVLVQVGVALGGAALLTWLTRTAVRVVAALAPRRRPTVARGAAPSLRPRLDVRRPRLAPLCGAAGLRGPPAPSLC